MFPIYGFILPRKGNDGRDYSASIASFKEHALNTAGGYTVRQVVGAWKGEDGAVYHDASEVVEVAGDTDVFDRLAEIAFVLFPDQLALAFQHHGLLEIRNRPHIVAVKSSPDGRINGVSVRHPYPGEGEAPARHRKAGIRRALNDARALVDRANAATDAVEKAQWELESALSGYDKARSGYRSSPKTGDGQPDVNDAFADVIKAASALKLALAELSGE